MEALTHFLQQKMLDLLDDRMTSEEELNRDPVDTLGSGHGHQCHSHAVRACLGAALLRVTTAGF